MAQAGELKLGTIATWETGIYGKSAAEIVMYQKSTSHIYFVNGALPSVEVIRLTTDGKAEFITRLALAKTESPTSVAVRDDLVAIAVHDESIRGRPGKILFFDSSHQRVGEVKAGFLPDMVTFSPDGRYVLAANEGEPHGDYDPEGSVTIIDLHSGIGNATPSTVAFADFDRDILTGNGVRIAPGKRFAEDAEPEYITVSADSRTAWVSLQENNALAEINIPLARAEKVIPLGLKDHSQPGNALDAVDGDGIHIVPRPLFGMYMPDSLASMDHEGKTFILTANEGDARSEEIKLSKAKLDPAALNPEQKKELGGLRLSATDGDTDGDGDIDRIQTYGARSFSIFDADGNLVFDSGSDFERITADRLGKSFNSDNAAGESGDSRSDNKGPEPEAITLGRIGGQTYAFIGLERVGGIMVYDVTDPHAPSFAGYHNSRNFDAGPGVENAEDMKNAGCLGPEGLAFVAEEDSPLKKPLLLVACEVSGSVEIVRIN
ncbi:choice-of-anchor I family protein [Emcibacter sp.]|uniref:choice-of-anchor I family protein n=1 Tax=Emcibacter sp. TaxID=1979954 RepID=UPI002AA79F4B|nr:choice-of-anchor I family protein [Emcibacter sp.]